MRTFHKPGGLVWLMIAASILACSVTISTAHVANPRLTSASDGEGTVRAYSPGATFVCAADLKDASDETRVRAVWRAGEIAGQPPDTIVAETEITSTSGPVTFEAAPPEGGWPRGNYQVELYVNGNKTHTLPFQVN